MPHTTSKFALLLLFACQGAMALSLHDLDPAFERCEAIKSQHGTTLPTKSDPFWSLEREQQVTVLIYLHEKSMERCTAAEVVSIHQDGVDGISSAGMG